MSDERIIEYLRERGRADVPAGFVASVMAAVDDAPPRRSWFAAYLPAMAGVAAVAVIAVLALVLGPGRSVGPGPTATPTPTATSTAGTVEDLRTELAAAVQVLREAPGVEGLQTGSLRDVLGGATWFDWRSDGDHVVVMRSDVDVTQSGWWMDPTGSPPAIGQRVVTSIWVVVGDQFLFGDPEGWQSRPRSDAPPVISYGTGVLDGAIDPTAMLDGLVLGPPDVTTGTLERRLASDGTVTWTAETPWRNGTAVQRWIIAPEGALRSWTMDAVGVTLDPDGAFDGNLTSATLEFEVLADPARIPTPDLEQAPDPSVFGLPDDFPLAASALEPRPEPVAAVQLATCADPTGTYLVTLPEGWWTNPTFDHPVMGEQPACHFFGPAAFDPAAGDPDDVVPPGVSITISFLDGGCIGFINPALSQRELEIDGWPATATEFAQGKEEANPPGHLQYVINLRPAVDCEAGGAFIVARTAIEMEGDYEANMAILDEVMASMEITFEEP